MGFYGILLTIDSVVMALPSILVKMFCLKKLPKYSAVALWLNIFCCQCVVMAPDCIQGNMLGSTLLVGCVLPVSKGELWEGLQGSWQGDILRLPLTHLAGISEPLKKITPGNIPTTFLRGHSQPSNLFTTEMPYPSMKDVFLAAIEI